MDRTKELFPATVPNEATQAGAIYGRWPWVEPLVWTERMLTALEQGVKGGTWFSLIDKVYRHDHLESALGAVRANRGACGVDPQTVEGFEAQKELQLDRLEEELRTGSYQPQAIRRVYIEKMGSKDLRPLGIPTVRDRVVQKAVCNVLEPIFEKDFAEHSYGFRPGRSCKDALRRVDQLLKQGYTFIVDADLKSYFDTIPWQPLGAEIRKKVSDGRLLALIEAFLKQDIMEGLANWTPEKGAPQGAVLSPLLSNIYLNPLDHLMAQAGFEMVRYADDFVILCRSEEEAERALEVVRAWVVSAGLTLHPKKTRIVDATQRGGFDFLGYHFERGYRWPRTKSLKKLKDTIRRKTRRANGHSLEQIIRDVNLTLRGWFEYFKHSLPNVMERLDGWIRRRLRSVLRKRQKRKGISRGRDHNRWPNAFFEKHGLFSLATARAQLCQSVKR